MDRSEEILAEARGVIERAGGTWTEEKGCLEVLVLLPLIGVMYYVYQILSGQ